MNLARLIALHLGVASLTMGLGCGLESTEIALPTQASAPRGKQPLAPAATATAFKDNGYIGLNGCAATACHGNSQMGEKNPVWESSFQVWYQNDPHRQAFAVLYAEQSVNIIGKLTQRDGRKMGDDEYFGVIQQRCLGCHATPVQVTGAASPEDFAYGVQCETCHGPASKWKDQHYLASRSVVTPQTARTPPGFQDTKPLTSRAAICTQCHVGPGPSMHDGQTPAPIYDVNHDLIAAGHPRLDFEFNSYLENLPAHWNRKADEERRPGSFHFDAWRLGRRQTQVQQVKLDEIRKGANGIDDFASQACHDCHHHLAAPAWRQGVNHPSRPRLSGVARSARINVDDLPPVDESLSTIQKQTLIAGLPTGDSWDQGVQFYLALAAFTADLPTGAEKEHWNFQAQSLYKHLQQQFSPSALPPGTYDSPDKFDGSHTEKGVERIRQALQRTAEPAAFKTP